MEIVMKTRIITALVAFAVFLPVIIFSATPFYGIAMAILATVGCFEMLRCLGTFKAYELSIPSLLVSALSPILTRTVYDLNVGIDNTDVFITLLLTYILWVFAVMVFWHKKVTVEQAAMTFMTTVYITLGFTSMVYVRDYDVFHGKWMYLVIFLGAWMTDIFAYFCGRAFGKHKLSPEISPKKTIEGSIGGVVFCIFFVMLYGFVLSLVTDYEPNYALLAGCGAVASVVSQIGDLVMSAIKRRYGIKDYGKVFPGHGGVLDRFDSCIAVAISVFALLHIVEKIGMLL